MKKTMLLLVCVFTTLLSLQAQTETLELNEKKAAFGIRLGYEFQANNSNLNYNLKLPYIGFLYDFRLTDTWSLQLELNLRSETREQLFINGFSGSEDELYLTVPILLKYNLSNKFDIYTGVQVLSASLVNDITGIKKWNGIFGLEYNWTENFFLDARFRHGLENRNSTNNFRDNRISLGIGYKF